MGILDGTVAIVTGGARGVGRAEAMLLAAQGASVVVNDAGSTGDGSGRDVEPADVVVAEIEAAGGRAVANYGDVADWDGGEQMIQQAVDTFGALDILVCNAGILRDRTMASMSETEWDDVMRVHLKGHFVPTHFASSYWREKSKLEGSPSGGRLVFTASEAGIYGNAGQSNYAAAKAGIAAMGISVARELSRYGVTCNTICPRARTRLTENIFGPEPDEATSDPWHPNNVAPLVAFLCSDDAANISGQTFVVGGGVVELLQGWQASDQVEQAEPWTIGAIGTSMEVLFDGRSSGIPALPGQFDLAGSS